jgi:hypothetical protein
VRDRAKRGPGVPGNAVRADNQQLRIAALLDQGVRGDSMPQGRLDLRPRLQALRQAPADAEHRFADHFCGKAAGRPGGDIRVGTVDDVC